jgi:serine protease Do
MNHISFKRMTLVVLLAMFATNLSMAPRLWANAPTVDVHPDVLNLQSSFSKVADLVMPAVVSITTTHMERAQESPLFFFEDPFERPQDGRKFKMEGMGSGVIIDPNGLVLTNDHVVRDADEIKVLLYDKNGKKTEYAGKVVGKDPRTDVAVVRIKAGHALPFAALGNSESVKVGDWAIAIGSPFGLSQTFTVGVISAARQSLAIEDREYSNLIQTDAAINRGNSGGPLLNIKGEVVGINTAIYAPTGVFAGIGFAVPINQAKAILDELVEKGHVVRGWLGVELAHDLTPAMVKAFGVPDENGALINKVMKKSPADKAGFQRGDIVRKFDGKTVESSDQLQSFVAITPPDKKVSVEVWRQRKNVTLSLVLGERPESADVGPEEETETSRKPNKEKEKVWLGAHVSALTPEEAENFQQSADAEGVLVADVEGGSEAEEMGLGTGDIIRGVNQIPTPNVAEFSKATGHVNLSEGVVLDILRQGRAMYLSYTKQ